MSRYNNHNAVEKPTSSPNAPNKKAKPGIDPDTVLRPDPDVLENGLPYISKSRITTYIKCPAKFYYKYICGHRTPGSYATEKGGRLHEAFETLHLNLFEYIEEHGERPMMLTDLLGEWQNWAQWVSQIANFTKLEERRWQEAAHHAMVADGLMFQGPEDSVDERILGLWEPVEVEAELWLGDPPASWFDNDHVDGEPDYVSGEPPVGDAPWMGRADLIVNTESVPGVDGTGVVIVDYKTGNCPTIRYKNHDNLDQFLNEGIFLEGEYYGWLAEENDEFPYEVDAVAGYYPKYDEFLVSPYPNKDRRRDIKRCVLGMQRVPEETEGNDLPASFPHEPQPLCNWGSGNCHFYNICESDFGN